MEKVTIRPATINDREVLRGFEQGVIRAERPFDKTIKESGAYYYDLDFLLTSEAARLAVAETNNEVVGCGYARIETSKPFLKHRQHAYLGFMYVCPRYRGRGINQLILDSLKEWVLSKGVTEFRLEIYAGNAAAIRAYEKAGFEPLLIEMRLRVD